jgi:two-component system, chemotaxis family, protein-glutamate methylesterase/glutaminase
VAEDSPTTRLFLVRLLESDPRLSVVGAVADGEQAVDFVGRNRVDVVLMDLYMPRLDGFEATRRLMETHPLPIVVCTSVADPHALDISFRSLEAGAVACIEKPSGRDLPGGADSVAARLVETVRLMAEVKVVRRSRRVSPPRRAPTREVDRRRSQELPMVGIGASTGGPPVLQMIFADLPKEFRAPILVVQHIARGFLSGMADWLNATTPLHVQVAAHGSIPMPGHVYLAPDDFHMGVSRSGAIVLTRQPHENGVRPSVSFLFRSLAELRGATAIGVLLSGMGRDGADELKLMRDKGATTVAQDRETSVVHGMPGEAIALGGATQILPAEKIAEALASLVKERNPAAGGETDE